MATLELQNDLTAQCRRIFPFLPDSVKGFFLILKALLEEALRIFGSPVEVLFRRRFGTRSLSTFMVLQLIFGGLSTAFFAGSFDRFFALFEVFVAVVTIYHYFESRRHETLASPYRYSYSDGEEQFFWESWIRPMIRAVGLDADKYLSVNVVYRFGEPLLCLAVAALMQCTGSKILPIYLALASLALLIKAHLYYLRSVNFERDRRDAELLGDWMSHRTAGRNAILTGYVVQVLPRRQHCELDERPLPEYSVDWPNIIANSPVPSRQNADVDSKASEGVICKCTGCHRKLKVRAKATTRTVKCPNCQTPVLIPATLNPILNS